MNREIKELVTKSGKKFTVKSYISYNEAEIAIKIEDKLAQTSKLIELALVSLEGSTENVYARARDLSIADYTDITNQVAEVIKGNFQPVK